MIALSSLGEFLTYDYEKGKIIKQIEIKNGEFSLNSAISY
jgi:hypothetical protein